MDARWAKKEQSRPPGMGRFGLALAAGLTPFRPCARAVAEGYANALHLIRDSDLDPLRRRADYADSLRNLAETPAAPKRPR